MDVNRRIAAGKRINSTLTVISNSGNWHKRIQNNECRSNGEQDVNHTLVLKELWGFLGSSSPRLFPSFGFSSLYISTPRNMYWITPIFLIFLSFKCPKLFRWCFYFLYTIYEEEMFNYIFYG